MIFHTLHTCTIDNFGLCFEYPKHVKLLPIPLPKKMVLKAFSKLVKQYNELTAKEKLDSKLDGKYHAANLEIRIQLYATIYQALKNSMLVPPDQEILDLYKKYFKKDFKYSDLDNIISKMNLLKSKYNGVIELLKAENSKEFDFIGMVARISNVIGEKIGNEKLYKMPYFLELADSKIKQGENK